MPWFVSIRIIGQVMGARTTVATRMSVIFSSEGFELVFVFWGRASRRLSVQRLPMEKRPAAFKKLRRAKRLRKLRFIGNSTESQCIGMWMNSAASTLGLRLLLRCADYRLAGVIRSGTVLGCSPIFANSQYTTNPAMKL